MENDYRSLWTPDPNISGHYTRVASPLNILKYPFWGTPCCNLARLRQLSLYLQAIVQKSEMQHPAGVNLQKHNIQLTKFREYPTNNLA